MLSYFYLCFNTLILFAPSNIVFQHLCILSCLFIFITEYVSWISLLQIFDCMICANCFLSVLYNFTNYKYMGSIGFMYLAIFQINLRKKDDLNLRLGLWVKFTLRLGVNLYNTSFLKFTHSSFTSATILQMYDPV